MRRSSALAFAAIWLLSAGCTPRCQESCAKVLDCGLESTRVARDECVLSCQIEETLYKEWEDKTKIQAFKEHKRCLRESSCEEIEAGVCYDEELFLYDPPTTIEG